MRRFGVVCAAVVVGVMSAEMQADAGPWRFGARAGVNLATIRGDFADFVQPKMQTGLAAGGFVEHALVPQVAFELDVLYLQKGFQIESEGTDQQGNPTGIQTTHLRLQYLEVPVLIRLSLPSWGAVAPYVIGGPTAGFALGGKFEGFGEEADVGDDLKKVDFGVTGGLGARFGSGPVHVGIESRYGTSFGDLWDLTGNLESINQGFSFTASVSR